MKVFGRLDATCKPTAASHYHNGLRGRRRVGHCCWINVMELGEKRTAMVMWKAGVDVEGRPGTARCFYVRLKEGFIMKVRDALETKGKEAVGR